MSAQHQAPHAAASQPADNIIHFPNDNLAADWEQWADGVYLIVVTINGRSVLQKVENSRLAIEQYNEQSLRTALLWAAAKDDDGTNWCQVFPCKLEWDAKKQRVIKKPQLKGGFNSATSDPERIKALWAACRGPIAIGMRCMEVLALDLDLRKHPEARAWLAENADRLATWGYFTQSAGHHYIYRQPLPANGGLLIKSNTSRLAPGVDIRGCDGYVVLWVTAGYSVVDNGYPNIADCPEWLIEQLNKSEGASSRRRRSASTAEGNPR